MQYCKQNKQSLKQQTMYSVEENICDICKIYFQGMVCPDCGLNIEPDDLEDDNDFMNNFGDS